MEYYGIKFTPLDDVKLSHKDMADFEEKYNIKIPLVLRLLFSQVNNSIIEDDLIIEVSDIIGGVIPERWTGIGKYGMDYLLDLNRDSLGKDLLPFCTDPGGNIFAVRMIEEEQNGVYFLDNEETDDNDKLRMYKICNNIEELLEKLLNVI